MNKNKGEKVSDSECTQISTATGREREKDRERQRKRVRGEGERWEIATDFVQIHLLGLTK